MQFRNKKILQNYNIELQKVDSLEKMDQLIDKVKNNTNTVCKDFRCKSGCFTCCIGPNVPSVYAKEWKRIREYINKMPEDVKNQIKANLEGLLKKHESLLRAVNNTLQEDNNSFEIEEVKKLLKDEYKEEICPLHINGKCSIYEVRPAKCRGFGYFSYKGKNEVILLTCEDLAKDIIKFSSSLKAKQIIFPYWNYFENKLNKIAKDESEKYHKAIIPFWLKSDFESKKI